MSTAEALFYGLSGISLLGNVIAGVYVLKLRGRAVGDGKDLRR